MDGQRPAGRGQRGSSLLEVLVALFILGLVFPALAAFLITTLRSGEVAANQSRVNLTVNEAESFARNAAEFKPCSNDVVNQFENALNAFQEPAGVSLQFDVVEVVASVSSSSATGMATAGNSLWVADNLNNQVVEFNIGAASAGTPRRLRSIPVGASPQGVAVAPGFVWVANNGEQTLTRINTSTGSKTTVTVFGPPFGVAYDSSTTSIWVTVPSLGEVRRVTNITAASPTVGSPLSTVSSGPPSTAAVPKAVVAGLGSVWVANSGLDTVARLSSSGVFQSATTVGDRPAETVTGMAIGAGSVWVSNPGSNSISRLTPSGSVVNERQFSASGKGPQGVAFDGTNVWVANFGTDEVVKFNPNDPDLLPAVELTVPTDPVPLASAGASVFVSTGSGSISRIDGAGAVDTDASYRDMSLSLRPCDAAAADADLQRWKVSVTDSATGAGRTIEFWKQAGSL